MSDKQPESKPSEPPPEAAKGGPKPQNHANYSRPTVPHVEDFGDATYNGNGRVDVGLKDLIQFFRKTPPPPTNFMSIPDNFSTSSEEDKWDKFKTRVFRRRSSKKSKKKRPPVIMLPDSAVAARTAEGHRYIAISIPKEHLPMEPRPTSQYPVYDSVEAAFHRDVNARFGMWKTPPANRLVTVLNPVPEDLRESISSGSPVSATSPGQATVLSDPAMRKRAHSVSHSPSKEQRYSPGKAKDAGRNRSVSDPHTRNGRQHISTPMTTAERSEAGSSKEKGAAEAASKDTGVAESGIGRLPKNPVITLTVPSRKSSRRGKTLDATPPAKTPPETAENVTGTRHGSSSSASGTNNGNGNGDGSIVSSNGGRQRGSFAASIETTGSSPQLLKAQTAIVGQSIPIVVRPADDDDDDNGSQPPAAGSNLPEGKGEGDNNVVRTSPLGPPPPMLPERSRSRKERVREGKRRDAERARGQAEHEEKGKGKGKDKEPASYPFGFLPGMPAALPRMFPSAILGHQQHRHHHHEHQHHHSGSDSSSNSNSSSPPPSLSSSHTNSSSASPRTHHRARRGADLHRSPSHTSRTSASARSDREARYVAKALAEERETLEGLPRSELVRRYEALRAQRIYERERRLRRLERGRDAWARAVPSLLQDLNVLLRQQQQILAGVGLAHGSPMPMSMPMPMGSSQYQGRGMHHRHGSGGGSGGHPPRHRHHRRRSRSVEVSSSSPLSNSDPLESQRSRSLHSSSESHRGQRSSKLRSE